MAKPVSKTTPTTDKPVRSTNKSYERIQVAALALFSEKGVHSTSIRDIGAEANVPTSLLYHYAPSKHQLVFDLMSDGMERYQDSAFDARALGERPEEKLVGLVLAHVTMHCRNRMLAKVIDVGWRSLPKQEEILMLAARDKYSRLWDEVLQDGMAEGVFDILDWRLARLGIVQMCSISTWYSPGGDRDTEALAKYFADLALGTLRAKRDGKLLRSADIARPKYKDVLAVVEKHHRGAVFGKRR